MTYVHVATDVPQAVSYLKVVQPATTRTRRDRTSASSALLVRVVAVLWCLDVGHSCWGWGRVPCGKAYVLKHYM